MTQITIIIALLLSLALGDATRSGNSPVRKVEPPTQQGGVAEGGWPAF
jgi:hypothetical protein